MPVTINSGMAMPAWYDMLDLDSAGSVDWATVAASRAQIEALIKAEHERAPLTPLFLGGFSQGAAMSLHTGLGTKVPLAGVIALSGYLLAKDGETGLPAGFSQLSAPPVFMGHGTWDDVLPIELSETARQVMHKAGMRIEWHSYPMPHSVSPRELQDLVYWFMNALGLTA
jgi:phospholipase/carboxylesterase